MNVLSILATLTTLFTLHLQTAPVKVQTGADAWPWVQVETWRDLDPHFVQESFLPDDIDLSANDLKAFGGATTPHSRDFLLHFGAGWATAPQPVPVLLIPGAIRSASVIYHDAKGDGTDGLAPYLISKGFKVFALTWGYNSGDNLQQAEQIANAIRRVKAVTGRSKVDLVTISKGGVPTRAYLSMLPASWRTPYGGDVRRVVFLGCPNLGVDAMFRHAGYGASIDKLMAWDWMLGPFGWEDTAARSLYNQGRFAGHAQMLHRWDGTYPVASFETDWYTSYYGGWGWVSHSQGIDAAAALADNLIDRLEHAGLHPGIQIAVLAGSKPYTSDDIPMVEYQAPGDTAVFLRSALHTAGMTQNGATVIKKTTLYLNHSELAFHPTAQKWVENVLKQ